MKYNGRELTELTDFELNDAHNSFQRLESDREKAKLHPKFQKMPFPDINNQAYLNYKHAILNEIENRKKNA